MTDLKVDYQLLTSIHHALGSLTSDYDDPGGAVVSGAAYGSGEVAAAMTGFATNWTAHRKELTATTRNLSQMAGATAQRFHQTDTGLAHDIQHR